MLIRINSGMSVNPRAVDQIEIVPGPPGENGWLIVRLRNGQEAHSELMPPDAVNRLRDKIENAARMQ